MKMRLDHRLLQLGLAPARQKATDYIKFGQVLIDGVVATRPSQRVVAENRIEVQYPNDYVSRGAHKLIWALHRFNINLTDAICLDVGACTGGFTQVCLEKGARRVFAVDVGQNQLHSVLRQNEKVVSLEGTHIKDLSLSSKISFICADVSFISLTAVIPYLTKFLSPKSNLVLLIKPQYEVGKEKLPPNGVIKDLLVQLESIEKIKVCALQYGLSPKQTTPSPIKGKGGNAEFLLHLTN